MNAASCAVRGIGRGAVSLRWPLGVVIASGIVSMYNAPPGLRLWAWLSVVSGPLALFWGDGQTGGFQGADLLAPVALIALNVAALVAPLVFPTGRARSVMKIACIFWFAWGVAFTFVHVQR